MGAYNVSNTYTIPSSNNFLSCVTTGTSVKKNSTGDAWEFTITVKLSSFDISVHNWNNAHNSTCTVTLYEGKIGGTIIGRKSTVFNNIPMTNGSSESPQISTTIGGIKGVARTIYVKIDCDITGVVGSNGNNGVYWISGGTNITNLIQEGYFDVSDIQLISKPVLGNIINVLPYDKNQGISSLKNSISIKWDSTGKDAPTKSQYQLNGGSWKDCSKPLETVISGLSPGTVYKIAVSGYNEAGWSDYIYITIRTLYENPVIEIVHNHDIDSGLEDFILHWNSDKDLKTISYTINSSELVTLDVTGKTGEFKINKCEIEGEIGRIGLYPNTIYALSIYGVSTNAYDHLDSNIIEIEVITDDIGKLIEDPTFNIGDNLTIHKENESGNKNVVDLYINGNNDRHNTDILLQSLQLDNDEYTFIFTQDMIDTIYRQFGFSNEISCRVIIKTFSIYDEERFYSSNHEGRVILVGLMKTAHSNEHYNPKSNERIYRAQIWYNPGDGPIRAVGWANVNIDGEDIIVRTI